MSPNSDHTPSPHTRSAPGPQGLPILGNVLDLRRKGVLSFYVDAWREFGDVTRFRMGPMPMHQFVRPEHIRHILVGNAENYVKGFSHDKLRVSLGSGLFTSEGDLWRRQRRLMQPTYTPRGVTQFAAVVTDSTQEMLARWRSIPAGEPLAINDEMTRLTMTIISRSMFSVDVGEEYAQVGQAITEILEFANQASFSLIDLPLWVPSTSNRRLKQALAILDEYIYGIVAERRQRPSGQDLLSTLMHARDEETGEAMDDKQLRDEVLITFFAGHETTALLLTWTWYMLSQHPEIEEQFHAELERALAGDPPGADDTARLTYTQMLIDEVLRLYSPVSIAARDVVEDDEIDGYPIPAGSMVTLTPYVTHRHPEFWEQPEMFDPEHFAPERVKTRPRYAYYPFGAGPRICIGKYFALQEAILVLVGVAQHYRLRLVPGLQVLTEWRGTLRPHRDVLMTLEARG